MDLPVCYTQFVRPSLEECPFEHHPDEGKVERDGYVPTEAMVEQLIMAGESLRMFRGAEFGPTEEVPDDWAGDRPINTLDAMQADKALAAKVAWEKSERERLAKEKKVADEKAAMEKAEAEKKAPDGNS
jgi:hypothetical protein